MNEQLIGDIVAGVLGLALALFPRRISAWYCGYVKEACRRDRSGVAEITVAGVVWVVERVSLGRVYDEATAPKAFRFVGFACILISLVNGLSVL